MDPNERRILCTFLGKNQALSTEMTIEKFKNETIGYIIDGVAKK